MARITTCALKSRGRVSRARETGPAKLRGRLPQAREARLFALSAFSRARLPGPGRCRTVPCPWRPSLGSYRHEDWSGLWKDRESNREI